MSRPATAPVPRLSGPGELAAAVPLLCGFWPQESLVVVALRGTTLRVGVTARYDLPAQEDEQELAADVVRRLAVVGARRAYALVVTSAEAPGLPRRSLVAALRDATDEVRLEVLDVLLVRDGRWWSYMCTEQACCPPEGTPVPVATPTLTLVEAQSVLEGRAVLASRGELVASLGPPACPAEALELLAEAERRLADELVEAGRGALRARLITAFSGAMAHGCPRDGHEAAELALALQDLLLRDEVLTWSVRRESALLALLLHLARATPAPYDAPVCACLAWVAYGRGDGATAGIALERALTTDPQHGLALLLSSALDRQVAPRQLRAVAVRTATALRRRG